MTDGTKNRSLTLQPEYTLPHGERLKEMARIGLAIAKVLENARDAPILGTKALREALEAAGVRCKGSRYWNSIEAAIAAAQASGWLETVKAEDGAEVQRTELGCGAPWRRASRTASCSSAAP